MRLETERLILREWEEKDVPDLVEGLNNIEVSKWLIYVPYPYTEADAKHAIAVMTADARVKDRQKYHFAIELKSEGKVIGGTSLIILNQFHGTASGGIWINENYHGSGYGKEAFGKRIEFAFETLGLRKIENGFLGGNESSFKMQEKLGYKIEGMRRQTFRSISDGKLKDEYLTGLLREEWNQK